MQINYEYVSPSVCLQEGDQITLGLSPDLSRKEKVSFVGKLKDPLIFRDAMLMLREIVISDTRIKKKDYKDFFAWFNQELDRRMLDHQKYLKGYKNDLEVNMESLKGELIDIDKNINNVYSKIKKSNQKLANFHIWDNYHNIEREFWKYIQYRDKNLWYVLDPVITVHPDQVSFEAFSVDESTYGCLSIDKKEFKIVGKPQLGTTNIDFSTKLAKEIERFRTYNDVELSINPEGLVVDSGVTPEHLEKKIDLPESWIKGFNQVSAAASLGGIEIEISPVDMYDICSFLRRHKANHSPRSMKWILEPNKRIRIIFEPWNKELKLSTIYNGKKKRNERIWGRRRWLIVEKIIPISKSFKIRLLGFGMPQFLIANLGPMKMTIGLTSWSANDWVKGTAFNILGGFIGKGSDVVYDLLKKNRVMTIGEITTQIKSSTLQENRSGLGMLLRKGLAYFDPIINAYRFRQLLNVPLPKTLYEGSKLETEVLSLLKSPKNKYNLHLNHNSEIIAEDFHETKVRIRFDQDGQIAKVKCDCKDFKKGPRNISAPCSHILALYITSVKFLDLPFKSGKRYSFKELEGMTRE